MTLCPAFLASFAALLGWTNRDNYDVSQHIGAREANHDEAHRVPS